MAIRPVSIGAGGIDVTHDERGGHTGTVPWSDVDFGRRPDGTAHQHFLALPCPVCGKDANGEWVSTSLHPVSGGADGPNVRELFARYYMRRAAALGLDAASLTAARALVAKRADELEGRATDGAAAVTGRGG